MSDDVRKIATDAAPAAIGPYSQAVECDGWIFASGQIALDPRSGSVVEGGVEEQTRRVLQNLGAVIGAAGGALGSVVKTTVYLSDMESFPAMNGVYESFFDGHCPARATVEVARLPRDVLVEIDAVARVI